MLLNIAMHRTNSYPALKVNVLRMKSYKLEARAGNILETSLSPPDLFILPVA